MKSRFGLFVAAIICPPLYFFLQKKTGLGIVYAILYVAAFPLLLFGIGFFMWLFMAVHAMISLSAVVREDTIQRSATVHAERMGASK